MTAGNAWRGKQVAALANGLGINLRPLLTLLGVAAAVAAGVAIVLWWRGPDWSLLYGSLSDSDESGVVQALQTANIPYKLDDVSGEVMVPAERVRDARLQLASQGLPAGKSDGFALISKDPGFGVSQFMENARYQYALETELAQTISSLQAVQAARVQLALSPQSAFISDHRAARASVLVQLRPGRRLEPEQVSAIVHLVASSVPELDSDQVTVVDQQGQLLSAPRSGDAALASEQFDAERRLEDTYSQHIEQLLAPLVGEGRVHAQVTVDLNREATEQASEQYKPDSAVVRSEQTSEQTSSSGAAGAGGIPGALTNQPAGRRIDRAGQTGDRGDYPCGGRRGCRCGSHCARRCAGRGRSGRQRGGHRPERAAGQLQAGHTQLRDRPYGELLTPGGRPDQAPDSRRARRQYSADRQRRKIHHARDLQGRDRQHDAVGQGRGRLRSLTRRQRQRGQSAVSGAAGRHRRAAGAALAAARRA